MEKNARVEEGKTPSIHSGRPSETTKDGEAVCGDELEKKATIDSSATITEKIDREAELEASPDMWTMWNNEDK